MKSKGVARAAGAGAGAGVGRGAGSAGAGSAGAARAVKVARAAGSAGAGGASRTVEIAEIAAKKRIRVAFITITVFMCGLLLLGLFDAGEKARKTTSAKEYLFLNDFKNHTDPLYLCDRITGFELTGVSADGSVIGYASDMSPQQSSLYCKSVLETDGWVLTDDNDAGVLSFTQQSLDAGKSSSLFVQFVPVGEGTSIVVQRW